MYMNKIGLCLIFCVFCFGNEEVYEFCAFFAENPNEYSLHPVSNNDLIIKSFDAYRTQGMEPNVHFRFDAPSDTLDSLIGACAVLNGLPIDDFNFHLNGASKNLEAHYGKILNGEVESYDFSSMGKKIKPFKFKIKGECKKQLVVAEYCVDKQEKRLYKTQDLDYLPKFLFSEIEYSWCSCEKYDEQVTTYIRNSKNKPLNLDEFITKGCDEYTLTDFVNVSDIQMLKDSVYNVLVENQAEIQIDSVMYRKSFAFFIRISGKCR